MLRIKSPARTLCAVLLASGVSVGACSGDDEVTTSGNGNKDSGVSGGAGGVLGTGGGSFGASGDSGSAGVGGNAGNGGDSGNGGASGSGFGGSGFGGSGASPPDASVGGTAGAGTTCNAQFCPNNGMGSPCCVTSQGPCGMNYGSGCVGDPGGNRG